MSEIAARRMNPEQRREHLLAVASEYVAAHGTAVSLDDIAREAGISPPLMRHYFKNRDGLLDALTDRATAELEEIFLASSGGDLGDRLTRYLDWVAAHQWAHWLWVASTGSATVPNFGPTRQRLAEATVAQAWRSQDLPTRVRSQAWIAAIESTVTAWLDSGCHDRDATVAALLGIAVRLDVVGASEAMTHRTRPKDRAGARTSRRSRATEPREIA